MSNAYRIHGARYLRKYTAADRSSIYAYMSDVKTIANTLCKVPWTRVANDIPATTTIHTEEGLDWNEPERERFDAAEWCGEHSNGFHRAFAQAACYVFKLPESAIGTSIEKLRIQVTSDAYNPYGARIAAMTSATLNIPTDCDTVRQGEVFRAPDENGMGAAPRLFLRNANGSQTWYANTELVELAPETPLTAKQYLFVFVCLENYNRGRDGWIEGSSYIDNDVEMTLATSCSDLVADDLNDLSSVTDPVELAIVEDGVVPDVAGDEGSVVGVVVTAGGSVPVLDEQMRLVDVRAVRDELDPVNSISGVRGAYARFAVGGAVSYPKALTNPSSKRYGVGFSVVQGRGISMIAQGGNVLNPRVVSITAASMVVPFSVPDGFRPQKLKFDFSAWKTGRTPASGSVFNVWVKYGEYVDAYDQSVLKKVEIYDASVSEIDGWSLVGRVDACGDGVEYMQLPAMTGRVGSLLITAYVPQGEIQTSDDEFSIGTGDVWYNPYSPDSVIGFSPEVYPTRDSQVRYHWGDRVAIPAPFSRFVANDVINENLCVMNDDSSIAVVCRSGDSTVYFTNDLKTLRASDLPPGDYYVDHNSGLFLARVEGGVIYASTDGQHWSETNLPTSAVFGRYNSLKKAGPKFFLYDGRYCSDDGFEWTQTDVNGIANSIVYSNGIWVLQTRWVLFYSQNGVDWLNVSGLDSGDGNLYVVNGVFYLTTIVSACSTNGKDWTSTSRKLNYIGYCDGYYFGISNYPTTECGLFYSSDGINFSSTNVVGANGQIGMLDGRLVAKCNGDWFYDSSPSEFKRATNFSGFLGSAKKIGSCYLVYNYNSSTGDGMILKSVDIESWEEVQLGGNVESFACANGVAVAIVKVDDVLKLFVSYDGESWSIVDGSLSDIDGVYYSNGLWIAISKESGRLRKIGDSTRLLPYVCVVGETDVGDVVWTDFNYEDNPVRDRMHGFEDLCVPNLTLIG